MIHMECGFIMLLAHESSVDNINVFVLYGNLAVRFLSFIYPRLHSLKQVFSMTPGCFVNLVICSYNT